ncbi:MAG: hypothetical protein FWE40_09055 [Oscillospiraceae bacterium]|nr:hypothetical protein [Oscillospiraceae bacterium]
MKKATKRILAVVLTVLMLIPLATQASAWQKTTVSFRFPLISQMIANPVLNMLPDLGAGLGVDLTGDLFTNYFVNDFVTVIAATAGPFANLGALGPFQALQALAPELSAATQADIAYRIADGQITATAPNNTWVHTASLGIDWGIECRETLLRYVPVIVRRFSSLAFRDDIRARWQSHYAPAFRALGVPESYIADQAALNIGWAAAQNFESEADVLLRSVFNAVLYFTEAMEHDLLGFLTRTLPIIAQNEAAINQLAMPVQGNPGFNPAGTSRNINLATDGYWFNADLTPRGGTVVGAALLGFLEVDVTTGGFLGFFEDTISDVFGEMGMEMPPIDWSLVYHAGDMVAGEFVTDEVLMATLILRYLARISAIPENQPALRSLVRAGMPGFQGILIAALVPPVLGLIFALD